ncbi:MAG TPA: hypothetical protein VKZ41_09620 [Gemmatimonadales bacterium]|nr:hypothetical protein [Gemmatimonadales bacterium]
MPALLSARAPVRVDLGGGWTDVPPYCDEAGGFVCNLAIARYATATLSVGDVPAAGTDEFSEGAIALAALNRASRGQNPVRLRLASDFPMGAGLGGSSAAGVAAVAVLAAYSGWAARPEEIAEESRSIEVNDLGVAGGRQDHYAAAFGGALALEFGNGVRVQRVPLSDSFVTSLESHMLILYTGQSRMSGATISAVLNAWASGEARVANSLDRMKALAREMDAALRRENVEDLGRLVGEHWVQQRLLHPSITTPAIDEITAIAAREGAWGSKALGASGGGCVAVLGNPESLDLVERACASLATPLPFGIDKCGVHVMPGDPNADTTVT